MPKSRKDKFLKKKQLPASRKDNCPQPPLGFGLDLVARGSHTITFVSPIQLHFNGAMSVQSSMSK